MAADQEYAEAQHNLGVCLFYGRGGTKDQAQAAAMFAKAAEKDHPESTHMLGVCFQNGQGVAKDKEKALELFRRAAGMGVEESKSKIVVMEERHVRESELSDLGQRIESIKEGFIQLQLERAATEEVTHAYKGAGFFLSNVKSETPIRARVEQAKKAESEIKALRQQLQSKEKERQELLQSNMSKAHEIERLQELLRVSQEETAECRHEIEALKLANKDLEAEGARQRQQIKDLLTENTELKTVGEWVKNQRIDVLKDSLTAVVRSTIKDADERERKLKSELEMLRARGMRPGVAGSGGEGEGGEHAAVFLKRMRGDVFLQDALVRHIITSVRDDDMAGRIASIKELADEAEGMEKLAYTCCEKLLEHLDTGSVLEEEDAISLRDSLNRIQGSIAMTLHSTKQTNEQHLAKVKRLEDDNAQLRGELADLKSLVQELAQIADEQRESVESVAASATNVDTAIRKVARKVIRPAALHTTMTLV
jgi:DNA repair exonuclease SbcCD ATPase subunit